MLKTPPWGFEHLFFIGDWLIVSADRARSDRSPRWLLSDERSAQLSHGGHLSVILAN